MSRTRFAPAPTGHLHLGHVVNAIHVWGLGRVLGASIVLRIEDHDRERSRPIYEASILEDLDWLGLVPDIFPTREFRLGACESRQSDRHQIYAAYANRLGEEGRLYGCRCTRRQMAQTHVTAGDTALAYPGTCRDLGIPLTGDVAWRVRLDGIMTDRIEELLAPPPAECAGDPVIRDRRGQWTYQFAVTVDDFEQEIDLVIRGRDLLESTGLQVRLGRLVGRTKPARFAHHALVMKSATKKLSKSDGDTGIKAWRESGRKPEDVIGHAAFLAGLSQIDEPLPSEDLAALFTR